MLNVQHKPHPIHTARMHARVHTHTHTHTNTHSCWPPSHTNAPRLPRAGYVVSPITTSHVSSHSKGTWNRGYEYTVNVWVKP